MQRGRHSAWSWVQGMTPVSCRSAQRLLIVRSFRVCWVLSLLRVAKLTGQGNQAPRETVQQSTPGRAAFLARSQVSSLGVPLSQDELLFSWSLKLLPGQRSDGQSRASLSCGPVCLCWPIAFVLRTHDGRWWDEWWAGDFGRERPNPCVAPGTWINIARVIAYVLLRIKSQLLGKLWSSVTRTARDTVPFLELWSALLVHCWILGLSDAAVTWI